MILYPSASRAIETEVRMLRSSSTSAIVGMVPPSMDRRAPARHSSPSPSGRRKCDDKWQKKALLEGFGKEPSVAAATALPELMADATRISTSANNPRAPKKKPL